MRILLTGFGPMQDWQQNSSEELVLSVRSQPLFAQNPAAEIITEILATRSADLEQQLLRLVAQHRPDACLFIGQARRRNKITLERFAVNRLDFTEPDASGSVRTAEEVVAGGPAAYCATLPGLEDAVRALNRALIPAGISSHAGTSLCNQLLYLALHHYSDVPSAFLHLPLLPEQVIRQWSDAPWLPLEMSREALRIIIRQASYSSTASS